MNRLIDLLHRAPIHVLKQKINKAGDVRALVDLANEIAKQTSQGILHKCGQLDFQELNALVVSVENQIEKLNQQQFRKRAEERDRISERPYLDPSLGQHDPRKAHVKETLEATNLSEPRDKDASDTGRGEADHGARRINAGTARRRTVRRI